MRLNLRKRFERHNEHINFFNERVHKYVLKKKENVNMNAFILLENERKRVRVHFFSERWEHYIFYAPLKKKKSIFMYLPRTAPIK